MDSQDSTGCGLRLAGSSMYQQGRRVGVGERLMRAKVSVQCQMSIYARVHGIPLLGATGKFIILRCRRRARSAAMASGCQAEINVLGRAIVGLASLEARSCTTLRMYCAALEMFCW